MDITNLVQKISTPTRLAGLIVVGIIFVATFTSSLLGIVSVSILGGLGVLAIVVMLVSNSNSKQQKREHRKNV